MTRDKNHLEVALFTSGEVVGMLETLSRSGIVERVPSRREESQEVDWEEDRWRLKGVFWSLGEEGMRE